MLYVTTRSSRDAFTVSRVLRESSAPEGGLFVPFRLVPLAPERGRELLDMGFARCCAEILNLFFGSKLSAWDVDFCVGKNLCKTTVMNHRIAIAELWHNQQKDFDWVVTRLSARLKDTAPEVDVPNDLVRLIVRIAALVGAFSELHRSGVLEEGQVLDVSVASDDFSQACAAWYCRYLGLPIGTILCACSSLAGSWDLMNYGQMRTDQIPADLERLIYLTLGQEEAARFGAVCASGRPYTLSETQTATLRNGLFSAVVGPRRISDIIPSVYRTNSTLLGPLSAQAYGGIQDYRAKTGEVRPTLILAEKSPGRCADAVAKAMGMSVKQLMGQFHLD